MIEQIESKLRDQLNPQHLKVEGDGSHFQVLVVWEGFEGKRRLWREQQVYAALGDLIADGSVHALSIRALTPGEHADAQKFGTL